MPRAIRIRLAIHGTVLVTWLCLSVFCLTTAGGDLARSLPFIAFDSNFAIVYSAAAAIEALWSGRKADPDDPA